MKKLMLSIIMVVMGFCVFFLIVNKNNTTEACDTVNTMIINESAASTQFLEIPKESQEIKQEIKPEITKQEELSLKLNEINNIEDKMEWFIAYKSLICEYAEWVEPSKTVFDAFTEDEIRLICRTVETETYDQDFNSKVNVACVIFNRIESGKFGDTVTEVITNPNQFAYGRKNITESTILAVMYAYEIEDTTNGCIAFRSGEKPEVWYINKTKTKYWTRQFIDDAGHGFYK